MIALEVSKSELGVATLARSSAVVAVHLGAHLLIDNSQQGSKACETRAHKICAWLDDGVREQIRRVPGWVGLKVDRPEIDEAHDGGDDAPASR